MLAELRQKAQITIPKEIIVKLGLSEGDKMIILVDVGHYDILKQFWASGSLNCFNTSPISA